MNKLSIVIYRLLLTTTLNGAAQTSFSVIREESPMWISYTKNFSIDTCCITFRWKHAPTYCGYTVKDNVFESIPPAMAEDLHKARERLWKQQQKNAQ